MFTEEQISPQLDRSREERPPSELSRFKGADGNSHSVIQVSSGDNLRLWEVRESAIRCKTKAIDSKDNVLVEVMAASTLYITLAANADPHPCTVMLPLFVDDLSVIVGTSKRSSTKVSSPRQQQKSQNAFHRY